MRKLFFRVLMVATIFLSSGLAMATETLPEYKDYSVVGVNRLPSRASFWYYNSQDEAKDASYLSRPDNVLLNGEWSFSFAESPAEREANFYQANYDVSGWDKIAVPGSWPLQGYDKPLYMNHPYEFKTKNPYPVEVPDEWNPVGSYRRDFHVPASWKDERVVLHFGAVKSSFYVWVNGKKVGYSQDSKMQAEFDITPYVKFGAQNSVSVEVYRFSMGSYLEGQDMWRLAGIKRDVWVYATPKSYIADFFTATTMRDDYSTGVMNLKIELGGKSSTRSNVDVELYSPQGEMVYSSAVSPSKSGVCNLEIAVENVEAWSDEYPNLYTLIMNYNGKYVGQKVGFRSVELKDSQMLINGKAVRIKGVNRHEHDPKTGHYIPAESMERDIRLMKEFNVNGIRTAHYPNDPYLYELADKYGVYICDEANIETHGLGATLQAYYDPQKHIADDIEWQPIMHDRFQRMIERDKNHPAIIFWSMGNECGDGVVFRNGYDMIKTLDPTRLILFEQAGMQSHTDIVAPMYATMDKIENYALATDTYRPHIMAEYAHAMGNSLGNFDDYWALFDKYPNVQGGFIWDWIDQGVEDYRDGERYFDYGGAFGLENMTNSGAFCLNGIVNPDGVPNPHAYQMRHTHRDVTVRKAKDEGFWIENKFRFTNLSSYTTRWSLIQDGVVVESGEMVVECAPEDETLVKLPIKTDMSTNNEYFVNFEFASQQAKGYLPAGHVVAAEQLQLKKVVVEPYSTDSTATLVLEQSGEGVVVRGEGFVYKFDSQGRMVSMIVDGKEFLAATTEYDFHRVAVDNDGWNKTFGKWQNAHKNMETKELNAELDNDSRKAVVCAKNYIDAEAKNRLNADFTTTYTIYADGVIEVDNRFIPISYHAEQGSNIPRLGERFTLLGDFDQVEWYGRGPWESYADRKSSAFVGCYSSSVDELNHLYINPQESGYRTDMRRVVVACEDGKQLVVESRTPLCFAASNYPKDNYYTEDGKKIRNSVDLKPSENLYLNIDYGQAGIGGDNSWGNPVHVEYQLLLRAYNYGYTLKPTIK